MEIQSGDLGIGEKGPAILIHGGAWNIPDEECPDHLKGLREALDTGKESLLEGEKAFDIVSTAISVMESSGAFDAGRGAVLTREGSVELDAGMMCGNGRKWGAVSGIRQFVNPIQIAKAIAIHGDGAFCFLAGPSAEEFAIFHGFSSVEPGMLICDREKKRYSQFLELAQSYHTSHPFLPDRTNQPEGTVGCVVRDSEGRLAAGTSTGGTPFRISGRVGDSPLPGCGFYSDRYGAASATGWGEAIASCVLCKSVVELVRQGKTPREAAIEVLMDMHTSVVNKSGNGATGGLIVIDTFGRGAWAFSTPRMARAGYHVDGQEFVDVF